MKVAVGIVLTCITLNYVGAGTSLSSVKSRELVAGSTSTLISEEPSWDFDWDDSGSTETSGSGYNCNQICPTEYKPVCASDGVTYANDCAFSIAQCKTTDLTLSTVGECASGSSFDEDNAGSADALCPDACLDVYDPVSDENGKIYSNRCFMRMAKCKSMEKDVDILAEYKRLYGRSFDALRADSTDDDSDSEESGSSSMATKTSTKRKKSMQATKNTETLKTTKTSSASASGIGSLYEDGSDGIIGSGSSSPTTKCAGACPDIYSPVCGSDGISYSNPCLLKLAACKTPKLKLVQTSEDVCADPAATTAQQEVVSETKASNSTKTA